MAALSRRASSAPPNTRKRRSIPDDARNSESAPLNLRSMKVAPASAPARSSVLPERLPQVTGSCDPILAAVFMSLVMFGIVMVYSASAVLAAQRHEGNAQFFLYRQAAFALVGLPLAWLVSRVDYHRLRSLTYVMLFGSLALLCITAFGFGHSAGGAVRWINLGPIHIQPSEPGKVAVVCWLAYSLSRKTEHIRSFWIGLAPHLFGAGALAGLCLMQPDFGSAIMIGLLTFFMLFVAGARVGYLIGFGLLAAPIVWQLVAGSEYRMRRIHAFLAPFEHRGDAGYQLVESMMGFGSGGLTGVGIGDSRQKLLFLPEAHTDFISSIVGEELGLVGFAALSAAFAVLVWRGLRAAFRSVDEYGTYLAAGLTLLVGTQAYTNLAVAVGLFPTKGLVLPFISYGGSSLLVNCVTLGVVLNISRPRAALSESAVANPGSLRKSASAGERNRAAPTMKVGGVA